MRFTWTEPDRESPVMDYETTRQLVGQHVGQRCRVSYPNGAQRVGVVGERQIGAETLLTFDGSFVMGELGGSVKIEAMQPNGRYVVVAS